MKPFTLVYYIPQEIAAEHSAGDVFKDSGDNASSPGCAIASYKAAQICKKSAPRLPFGRTASSWLMKASSSGPVMRLRVRPSRASGTAAPKPCESFAAHGGLGFLDLFHIIKELERTCSTSGEAADDICGKPFVLAHDVARRFYQAADLLGS